MINNAILKYYKDINIPNFIFSVGIALLTDISWGILSFCTFGIGIGFILFNYLKKQEYYLYYNLGYTKKSLLKSVFIINASIFIPLLILLILIRQWLF